MFFCRQTTHTECSGMAATRGVVKCSAIFESHAAARAQEIQNSILIIFSSNFSVMCIASSRSQCTDGTSLHGTCVVFRLSTLSMQCDSAHASAALANNFWSIPWVQWVFMSKFVGSKHIFIHASIWFPLLNLCLPTHYKRDKLKSSDLTLRFLGALFLICWRITWRISLHHPRVSHILGEVG